MSLTLQPVRVATGGDEEGSIFPDLDAAQDWLLQRMAREWDLTPAPGSLLID